MNEDGRKGQIEEARAMFEDMSRQIKQLSAEEHEAERLRSPLIKTLGWLTFLSALFAAAIGIYGIVELPLAPIREGKDGRYYARHDTPSTREDYEKYQIWVRFFLIGFGTTFILGMTYGILDTRERKRNRLPI